MTGSRGATPRLHRRIRPRITASWTLVLAALLLLLASPETSAAPSDPNFGHKVTLCHATGSASNPFVIITVDVMAGGLKEGHESHGDDIIPAFTYVDKDGATHSFPGQNMGSGAAILANGCEPSGGGTVIDVCPNIDGNQATIPAGLVRNGDGECVEPAGPPPPPPPPAATDLCPNIDGVQASVPSGQVRNAAGDCVTPPTAGVIQPPTTEPPVTPPPTGGNVAGPGPTDTPEAVAGATSAPGTAPARTGTLPFTGAAADLLAALGAGMLLAGLALHVVPGRRRGAQATRTHGG